MNKISAVIITLNEGQHIARCIRSLQTVADEVIVVDSYSSDDTAAIAGTLGARVYKHHFKGYGEQKNIAVAYARHDYILNLDADEALSPELAEAMLHVKSSSMRDAYACNRLTNYCGKWIRHCGWYPDKLIRLWHKERAGISPDNVHERLMMHQKQPDIGFLAGDLLHYSYRTISDHIKKIEQYSEIGAREDVARGKNCSILKLWLLPKWIFFTIYILRLGILDGYYGYVISKNSAFAAFVKYLKIRQFSETGK